MKKRSMWCTTISAYFLIKTTVVRSCWRVNFIWNSYMPSQSIKFKRHLPTVLNSLLKSIGNGMSAWMAATSRQEPNATTTKSGTILGSWLVRARPQIPSSFILANVKHNSEMTIGTWTRNAKIFSTYDTLFKGLWQHRPIIVRKSTCGYWIAHKAARNTVSHPPTQDMKLISVQMLSIAYLSVDQTLHMKNEMI